MLNANIYSFFNVAIYESQYSVDISLLIGALPITNPLVDNNPHSTLCDIVHDPSFTLFVSQKEVRTWQDKTYVIDLVRHASKGS